MGAGGGFFLPMFLPHLSFFLPSLSVNVNKKPPQFRGGGGGGG